MFVGVDVGGTFTDAVLVDDESHVHTAKVPSTPAHEAAAVLASLRTVLARAGRAPQELTRLAHGMTVATNALLEGRGARTALLATAGFTDVLELGRQARPHLYRLCDAPPAPLVGARERVPVAERMGPDGPLEVLTRSGAADAAEHAAELAPEAVAVSLLHAYADASHERLLEAALRERLPGVHVSLSSDLVGTFREYERTATTALDAVLSPLLARYLAALAADCADAGAPAPQVMQSSGGLTDVARAGAHAALTVLSGPAGGVGGAQLLASLAGERHVLCFDMGGTSCDVCVIDGGDVAESAERVVAGRPLALPALDIHTVGAGGGSVAWRDAGGALRVGPRSAGAEPGPACYGRGGREPTVTDANVVLGRLPSELPLAGGVALDRVAAERAISALAGELELAPAACAEGIVRVAEAEMLAALRLMTVERGIDPRGFALMPFGGAGPLHAAALAEALGIGRILCPRASGVLSALGLAAAAPRRDVSRTVMLVGAALSDASVGARRVALAARATGELGEPARRLRVRHELRYRGQSFELAVEEQLQVGTDARDGLGAAALRERFAEAHERRYGYRAEGTDVELVTMRASAWGAQPALRPVAAGGSAEDRGERPVRLDGRSAPVPLHVGEPAPGEAVRGPAVWALAEATLLVPPGWAGAVDDHGTIALRRAGAGQP